MKTNKIQKIKDLTAYLNRLRDKYYNESESMISDFEYDKLYDELEALEKETGFIMANSPTNSVGYKVLSGLEKIVHSHPMLSLDKTKVTDDLVKFAGNQDCILSLKLDGLTVLLTYDDGKLVQAETRGDGYQGELITNNAIVFENVPLQIAYKGKFEIEGEAIITYDDFDKINKNIADEKYKNPRNLVSGSVRQLNNEVTAKRHVKFIAWKVPTITDSMFNGFQQAKFLGFDVVPFLTYTNKSSDKENIFKLIDALKNKATSLGYPIDGLVMAYDDIKYGLSLGMTGHHPRHSIAFKFYDETEESTLIDIVYDVSKNGILTPVALFEPIEIDGTTVERASLHNLTIMKKTLGYKPFVGQPVLVSKRNCIIPQIENSKNESGEWLL